MSGGRGAARRLDAVATTPKAEPTAPATAPGAADAPPGDARPRTAAPWVKLVVGFHVFATTVWALPNLPEEVQNGKVPPVASQWLLLENGKYLKTLNPVKAYLFATGTWQYWDMFAPNPSSMDWWCDTEVQYRDGTRKVVPYPRIYDLPIQEKFLKERYRKFFERRHTDTDPMGFPSFGLAMAQKAYTDPKNPPVVVRIRRHWLQIADPGKKQDAEYGSYAFFTYVVEQAKLRQAVGGA